MRKVVFSSSALNDLRSYRSGNQKLVFKILELITEIQKEPFKGTGKPEPLKANLQRYWSRRINDEHRLVYKVSDDLIEIISCYGHYDQ
ncbi:Txe/YoeB family addiction module toxin [Nemorincola caseinilytica]|uniref:Txe/YoeB family addiction module toxin n=1 Tax=Nemorincola caseinilytica TaxID=2054315 RepID=UPI0031EF9FEC